MIQFILFQLKIQHHLLLLILETIFSFLLNEIKCFQNETKT